MAAGTVRIKGYREAMRALESIKRGAGKALLGGLMEAAEPVRKDWVSRLERYPGASTSTIGPKALTKGIVVQQRKRKVTGQRADFGSLQMRHGFDALESKQDETLKLAEKAMDDLTREEGF